MSVSRYRIPLKVRAMLHDRGETVAGLAHGMQVSVARVQWALSGHPDARPVDRRTIAGLLRPEERREMGWDAEGNPVEQTATVSRGTFATNARYFEKAS